MAALAGPAVAVAGGALLAADSIRAKPSGKKAVFKVFPAGDGVRVEMHVKRNGELRLLKSRQAPPSFDPGDGVRIDVAQEGDGYAKNGGQGLLSSTDDAIYFGWDIDKKGKLDFFE